MLQVGRRRSVRQFTVALPNNLLKNEWERQPTFLLGSISSENSFAHSSWAMDGEDSFFPFGLSTLVTVTFDKARGSATFSWAWFSGTSTTLLSERLPKTAKSIQVKRLHRSNEPDYFYLESSENLTFLLVIVSLDFGSYKWWPLHVSLYPTIVHNMSIFCQAFSSFQKEQAQLP